MEDYLKYGDLVCLHIEGGFYASTRGFISTSLSMEKSDERDFFQSIFRVYPQTIHSIQNEITSSALKLEENFKDLVLRLKESAEGEVKTNMQIFTNFNNQPIKYGSLIQLQHIASGKFLSVDPTVNAEQERDNFKVVVKNFVSDYSQLRVHPGYKYQKEGSGYARYEDSLFLEFSIPGINKAGNLHVSEASGALCKEINCSLDTQTLWQLKLYLTMQDSELLITGDYIWLFHTEHGSSIIKRGNSLVFSNTANDSNGIWKIEGENSCVGEVVKTETPYRIQHLCSGLYLSLKTDFFKGKTKLRLVLSAHKDVFSTWKFVHVYKRKKSVEKSQLYSLINCETESLLDCRIGKDSPLVKNTESEIAFFKILKCEESDIKHTELLLSCTIPVKKYFKYIKKFDPGKSNLKNFLRISENFTLCLEQLSQYLNNELIGFIDFQRQFGQIQIARQQSLKEQKFIEMLTDILKHFNPDSLHLKSSDDKVNLAISNKLLETVSKIYDLLVLIVQRNLANQSLAFEFLDVYKTHANIVEKSTKMLLSLVETNQSLLFSLSKPPSALIQHYTWLLRVNGHNRKPHLVHFLQSICCFQGTGVKLTQERIHEHLFTNAETFKKAVITTIAYLDELKIILPGDSGDEEILLNECFLNGDVKEEYHIQINYFIRMLDLFAFMCKDRNYTCKSSIKDWFPIDVLLNYIWNDSLSPEMRASFVRLIINLYVDTHPRHEERFPESVKVLSLQENEDLVQKFKDLFRLEYSDVSVHGLIRTGTTFSKYSKINLYDNGGLVNFEGEELTLFRLKENLIEHLKLVSLEPVYDVLLFELIYLASQLVKFKIITTAKTIPRTYSALISPYNIQFNYEELDLTRLAKVLIDLLVKEKPNLVKFNSLKDDVDAKKVKIHLPEISEAIFEKAEPSPMKQVLRVYSNYIKMQTQSQTKDLGFDTLCKIEICKLLDHLLNWRLDFLVNNIISYFNERSGSFAEQDLATLFPPIGRRTDRFTLYKEPEIKDLAFYNRNIYFELIVQFIKTKDYELRTLILNLLTKSFHVRVKLLKEINKIQIVTTVETSEMYIWMKNTIKIIKQIAEQSELWLNYWTQINEAREKSVNKIMILQLAIEEIEKALDCGTKLQGVTLSAGKTGVLDKSRQRTFINLFLHEYIIGLLQDSMQSISELYSPFATPEQQEAKKRFTTLLKYCYRLLANLVKDNNKIQEVLYRYLNQFMEYIHIPVGQLELICEIFKGNNRLCSLIDEKFLLVFTDLIFKYGRQTKFLEIFQVVQGQSQDYVVKNQRLVVKVLLEQDIHFLCYMQQGKKQVFDFEVNPNAANEEYKDEPFIYHSKLLQIISISAFGSTGVYLTEIKCQKLINADYIFELLSKGNEPGYKALFGPLLEFFFHAFIDTEKITESLINYPTLVSFISSQAEQMKLKSEFTSQNAKDLGLIVDILTKYINFYFVGDYFDSTFKVMKQYLEVINNKIELLSEASIGQETLEKLEALGAKYEVEFPPSILANVQDETNQSMNVVKSSWSQFKQNILYNSSLKYLLKEEKGQMVQTILDISKFNNLVTASDVVVSILEYINNYTFHKPKVSLLNKALKMLTYFLSHIPINSADILKAVKLHLNEAGVIRIIMALLSDPSIGANTFIYLLILSNELLDEGDSEFQFSFFHYFTVNQSSQSFFARIHSFFTSYISTSKSKWGKDILIYKKQVSGCKVILRFLQLLCENHNSSLQNYLRDQYKFRHTYNLVLSVVNLLEDMLKKCRDFDFLVISQCFDTLTEFIQGPCRGNQIAVVDSKFLEVSSRLLSFDEQSDNLSKYHLLKEELLSSVGSRDNYSSECLSGWMIAHLKYKCMITLLSLLEGQSDNYIITRLIRSLSIEILKENIISVFYSYTHTYSPDYYDNEIFNHFEGNEKYHPKKDTLHTEKPEHYELIIEVGFMIYHLMCHFKDNEDPENKRIIMNELPELAVNEENQGFIVTKIFADLGKFGLALFKTGVNQIKKMVKTREKFKDEVDKLKILKSAYSYFQKHTGNIEIIFNNEIFRIYFWIRPEGHFITEEQKENFHFYVERSSNKAKVQYLLAEADKVIEEMINEFKLSKLLKRNFLVSLVASYVSVWKEVAFLMTILLNLIIIMSFFNNSEIGESLVYDTKYSSETQNVINIFGIIQMGCSCCIVAFFLLKTAPVLIARGWSHHNWNNQSRFMIIKMLQKFKNGILTLYFALSNFNVLYQLGYLSFSVLGTAVNPLFFSFHLLDILYRYPTLQNVVKSITIPRKSLFLSFLLILVLLYLFSIWTYLSFYSYFNGNCENLIMCLKVIFDQGLKNGGGIGEFLNLEPEFHNNFRLVFDTLFYIMIIQIMLSVIQGIIVDTFAYLREVNDMNTEDRENRCFICSLDKVFIEFTTERPFKYHTTFEHSEWNYIIFINYLNEKKVSERTGMESYLAELIEKKESGWIPQYRALSIKRKLEGQEDRLKQKLQEIDEIYGILDKEIKEVKRCMMQYLENKHIIR